MKKIIIVGCPASGKTTLAKKLGDLLNIPIQNLDDIFWTKEGGIKQEDFTQQQEKMMSGEKWIIDGNFMKSKSFEMRLKKAETIIFYNFSKITIYFRLLKRYLQNLGSKKTGYRKMLNLNLIKFIWNYPTEEIYNKILHNPHNNELVVLNNPKDERDFIKEIKNALSGRS